MKYKSLFLMVLAAASGCATQPPVKDVSLDLPASTHDSCVPLKANVYGFKVAEHLSRVDSPKADSVTVPSNTSSIYVNCEEAGPPPPGCDAGPSLGLDPQEFQVDLSKAADFTLECRIVGWSTLDPQIEVFITKPRQEQLLPPAPQ